MGSEPRFCSYLDMPLQHSHPEMLHGDAAGRRAPTRYLRLLDRARELAPDIFLRSTFIVGFPGETEEHFDAPAATSSSAAASTTSAAFVYSPEEGTPAAELAGRGAQARGAAAPPALLARQRPIALARRQRAGRPAPAGAGRGVCEESEHLLQGRHHGMAPDIDGRLLINDGIAPAGTFAEVEITEAYADDLVGRIVGAGRRRRRSSPSPR